MKQSFLRVMAIPLAFALHSMASAGILQEHQGRWLGEMKVPDGRLLKMGVEVFARADGSFWASVSSPD